MRSVRDGDRLHQSARRVDCRFASGSDHPHRHVSVRNAHSCLADPRTDPADHLSRRLHEQADVYYLAVRNPIDDSGM